MWLKTLTAVKQKGDSMVQKRIVDENGYPLPGLLDLFTRRDELEVQIIEQLKAIRQLLGDSTAPDPSRPDTPLLSVPVDLVRVTLFDHLRPYTASITYYPPGGTSKMADCRQASESVLIIVQSNCNQALTIQGLGSLVDQADSVSAFTIGASVSLGVAATLGLGIDLSVNWYPYLGCSIASGVTPPTAGDVTAWAFIRKFR